ncbi:L10-interacting MYB domain-containing protein [Ananas comosus]|uniref:L10-interacting MYB domain-containing protein n=1 Tax=Ananas comosus TaxID=4615 RepID=A0A199URV6_ANACO|nr:L10-interacting MYB domain-containing protein [Ananas comosus]
MDGGVGRGGFNSTVACSRALESISEASSRREGHGHCGPLNGSAPAPSLSYEFYKNNQDRRKCKPSSSRRPNGDGVMKIFVRSENYGNFALEVEKSNTIEDVLITILPHELLQSDWEPLLISMAVYYWRLRDLWPTTESRMGPSFTLSAKKGSPRQWPKEILERKKIKITDRPSAIREKAHYLVLLNLLVKQIQSKGRKILDYKNNSRHDIVVKFNEATGKKYEDKQLHDRFKFYECEYGIVRNIKHHPEFSWDHQRQVVIATDAKWNKYIKGNPSAKPYRRRENYPKTLLDLMVKHVHDGGRDSPDKVLKWMLCVTYWLDSARQQHRIMKSKITAEYEMVNDMEQQPIHRWDYRRLVVNAKDDE